MKNKAPCSSRGYSGLRESGPLNIDWGEGDGDVGEDGGGVREDRGDGDGPRRRSGATGSKGERAPPPSSSSLTFSLDGRRVSPLVHGLHGVGGARAPPRLDLSLRLSPLLRSLILLLHRFLYIWRSVTPIGLNLSPRSFS